MPTASDRGAAQPSRGKRPHLPQPKSGTADGAQASRKPINCMYPQAQMHHQLVTITDFWKIFTKITRFTKR